MELAVSQVETAKSLWLPNMEETLILPVGDLQLDPYVKGQERASDVERFKRYIKFGVEHNAYFLGMGDYGDVMSPTNREKYKNAGFYDSVTAALEVQAEAIDEELQELLGDTKGRWLGLLEGHHYFPYQDGTTTDTRLANFLGTSFLGTCSVVQVKFKPSIEKKKAPSFTIWAHHGRAGGKMMSTPLNQIESTVLKSFNADVYFVGHHHKLVGAKSAWIDPQFPERGGKPTLRHKDRIVACTGSFLKGYLEGSRREGRPQGSYVEKGMMSPVALGGAVLIASPRYEDSDYAKVQLDIRF